MDETHLSIVIGVIFLILIVNTTMLFSLISVVYAPEPGAVVNPSPDVPSVLQTTDSFKSSPAPVVNPVNPLPTANIPSPIYSEVAAQKIAPEPPEYYVTMEPQEPDVDYLHQIIQPEIPRRSDEGYVIIFSLKNHSLFDKQPSVSFNLVNPPLIIEYNVTPFSFSDTRHVEYKRISTSYGEDIVVDRPYEGTWVKVVVKDKATGQIVTEDGYGNVFGKQTPREIVLYNNGNYLIEISGAYAAIDLTMKVKTEGNIPGL